MQKKWFSTFLSKMKMYIPIIRLEKFLTVDPKLPIPAGALAADWVLNACML